MSRPRQSLKVAKLKNPFYKEEYKNKEAKDLSLTEKRSLAHNVMINNQRNEFNRRLRRHEKLVDKKEKEEQKKGIKLPTPRFVICQSGDLRSGELIPVSLLSSSKDIMIDNFS